MNRTTYLLKDLSGTVQARLIAPADEGVVLEPWMIQRINSYGWRIEAWDTQDSGVQIHGWADWESVADNMAAVLRTLLSEERTEWSDEDGEQLLAAAQAALDDYHVAQMEVSVARDEHTEQQGESDGSDG